jgi:hypothetical protein
MAGRPDKWIPRDALLAKALTQPPDKYPLLLSVESVSLASKVLPSLVLVE